MKVLQLHTRYRESGGEDRVVDAEAEVLRSAGHDVDQLLAENPLSPVAATTALMRSPWNPTAQRAVERAIETFQPDVAHVHNTWFALSPAVVETLRRSGVPTVMTVHNYRLMCVNSYLHRDGKPCTDCVGRSPWPGVRHRCYRHSAVASTLAATTIAYNRRRNTWARGVGMFLAPTEFVRHRLLDAGFPADRIRVKPHFVEDPGPRPAPPSTSRVVLHVGRLSPEKGAHELLSAWEALGETPLELVFVGDGPLHEELVRRRVPRVRFVGRVEPPQVRDWMLRARVLVAPSLWYETFGLVVAEAMAAGLPVIVPPDGALAEVAGGAAVQLAGTGSELSGDPLIGSLRRAADNATVDVAGASGRERFSAVFTKTAGLSALADAYRSVVAGPAGASASSGARRGNG